MKKERKMAKPYLEFEDTHCRDGEHIMCPYCRNLQEWKPLHQLSTYEVDVRVTVTCERCKEKFSGYFYWPAPVFVGEPWYDFKKE